MKRVLLNMACLLMLGSCFGQNFSDRSSHTIDVSQMDRFQLYNRRGAVTVKATNGNTVKMEVKRSLGAKSSAKLEEAKKNIYLDSMKVDGGIVFFIQQPNMNLEYDDEKGYASYNQNNQNNQNNWRKQDHIEIEFTITLEVPARMNLVVVNHEHPLKVNGMKGELIARNHHDGVLVENQGGSASVHSHHGDVEVFYTQNPTKDCRYGTHHGDIRVHYQTGLSADASLYSYHGEFFSEMDWKLLPMKITNEKNKQGTKYKVKSKGETSVKIGSGGPAQQFRTHHGDVYLLNK